MNKLQKIITKIAHTVDIDHLIDKNKGYGFKELLVKFQDMVYNRFKKLYPEIHDSYSFDEYWNEIEQVTEDILNKKLTLDI